MPERRAQLVEVALAAFAEHGFRGTTTRQIAAEAGVTEAVIFQHFGDKEALYAAVLESQTSDPWVERWFAELERHRGLADDRAVLRTLFDGILWQHDQDAHFLRLMVYSALEQHRLAPRFRDRSMRLYRFLEAFIADGQRAGRFRQGSIPVLARAVLALPVYYNFQRRLFRAPWPAVRRAELMEAGIQFTLGGLAGPASGESIP